MITVLSGVPGSGKTYRAVYLITKHKDQEKVIHNIDSLKIGKQLHEYITENNISSTIDLFRRSFHESTKDLYGYLIVIDEAQTLFPKQFKDTDVIAFFDLHRHYGIDIILITQDSKKVCYDIVCLAELQFRAISSASNPIPGTFLYRQEVGGESTGRSFLLKNKEIFKLYKSTNDHSSSISNVGRIYITLALVAALGFGIGLYKWFSGFKPEQNQKVQLQKETASIQSGQTNFFPNTPVKSGSSATIVNKLGGKPFNVSKIRDYSGEYIVFMGNFYRKEDFPWKLAKTRLSLVALLPPDVYEEAVAYQSSIEAKSTSPVSSSTSPAAQASGSTLN